MMANGTRIRLFRMPDRRRAAPPPADPYRRALGRLLRVVAGHADLWNIPGGDIDDVIRRSALLDRYCDEIGRDSASVTRSIHLRVSYDEPSVTRDEIGEAMEAGFQHIILGLTAPYPANVAQWVTDELITTSADAPASAG
jgi:alkanesulfonate monooxygenase SsuD/methylene tetrahydromethanopterin reductase-like flavin-dependent oxidoreductase (luciferase family)